VLYLAGLDAYVKLYCNFNGTDASTTILDNYGGKTITVNGNAQLDTAQKKFGLSSLLLDGNGDFLSVADNADFYYGSGDFTIDCQVRINSLPSSGNYACVFAQRATSTSQNSLGLFIKNNSGTYQLYASFTYDGTTEKTLVTDYAFATGQFYHIEICREGNWLGYFVDGENIGSYYIGTNSLHNSTAEFKIGGSDSTTANYLNGWIDDFRLSKGICRHTLVSYTPPTTAYTADIYDVLLLHMDGTNDSTTFTDSCGNNAKSVTANGNAQLDTADKKFGSASILFDGNGDYLSLADSDDWSFGSDTFTIDFWFKPNAYPLNGYHIALYGQCDNIGGVDPTNIGHSLQIYNDNGTYKLKFFYSIDGSNLLVLQGTASISGGWQHLAIVRYNGYLTLFVDGTTVASTTISGSLYNSTETLIIGAAKVSGSIDRYFSGWIDEFRISKGSARFTTDFTPSVSEYSSDIYTKLLLHGNGTDASTTITDSSGVATKTVTANGNAILKTSYGIAPKFGTGMAYFDGNGDYLTIADHDDFNFGNGDFTIDFWFYSLDVTSRHLTGILNSSVTLSSFVYLFEFTSGGKIQFQTYSGSTKYQITGTTTLSENTWYHIEVVRNNGNLNMYLNGNSEGTPLTNLSTNSINNGTTPLTIGRAGDYVVAGYYYYGYIEEFRVSKGIARHTSAFTPSTSAYESDSYTKLLLHTDGSNNSTTFTDSGNTGHTVTPNGDAKIKTTSLILPKIGTAMGYFDGNGDYLSIPDTEDWNFGSGDFVLETYVLVNVLPTSGYYNLFTQRASTTSVSVCTYIYKSDSKYYLGFEYSTDGSSRATFSAEINLNINTWYHIVYERYGNIIFIFVDGHVIGSLYISNVSLYNSSVEMRIGLDHLSAYLNGYLDELRISKGIARFTPASFTPPTAEYGGALITTGDATSITQSQFNITGTVTTEGTVTERGFVYAITSNPTTANSKKIVSGTTGSMSATITGLTSNSTYHVRAYAIVDGVTYYGNDVSVATTTRQGVLLEILEYQSTETAEADTSASQIVITEHNLSAGDMIVNTSCRGQSAERGARLVGATGLTADIIPLDNNITAQTQNDLIRLYKFVDRTDLVKIKSFRMIRRTGGKTEANFVLRTTAAYILRAGQYVRINWNVSETSTRKFLGVIKSIRTVLVSEAPDVDKLFLSVSCVGLNQIPSRRTIQVAYSEGDTYGSIVEDMVDSYLYQDGIRKSTIDTGEALQDDWNQDVVSISEVLDECASKSGYQWFINDEGLLCFYQDPVSIPDAIYDITDAGAFKDYTNLEFEESIDNYINKMFVAGGRDTLYDNDIIIGSEDFAESETMQDICAGTGVYGTVQRDAGIVESNFVTAEAGTTTTNIKVTAHGQQTGYMIWNSTRSAYRQITRVDADNFSVAEISGQTDGDDIVFFDQANKIIANEFKLRGFVPKKFSFTTREMGFEPGSKIQVDLARYGISTEYYVIDDVEIYDEGGTVQTFRCRVSCSLRDNSNFSTQRLPNYYNFFGGF